MGIDWRRLGRWFRREAVPVALALYDVESDARRFARKNNLPEEACVELAEEIRRKLIEAADGW